ncbi:ribonuclease H1 [Protopterus annectens]|uniref:ribonuclease H1 n=1 Tax=Protopterus annectens TaxID=7888 RepID=UPI001CFBDE09|nr:ribonuclease H1 [Protopterus annectens]
MLKLFYFLRVVGVRLRLSGVVNGLNTMGKGVFYYAVRRGRMRGVYPSWEQCKEQVDKFPGASYKKFALENDAWEFIGTRPQENSCSTDSAEFNSPRSYDKDAAEQSDSKKRSQTETSEELYLSKRRKTTEPCTSTSDSETFTYMGDAAVVYTDGCCTSNGREKARAGVGVYWGPDHPLNVCERLDGRQTNQRAEIQAACQAIEQAKKQDIKKLVIYTDSKFTINGATKWVESWKRKDWKLSTGKPVINREDFERLDRAKEGMDITWMHIPGHAGFKGNEEADRLSREGAKKPKQKSPQKNWQYH